MMNALGAPNEMLSMSTNSGRVDLRISLRKGFHLSSCVVYLVDTSLKSKGYRGVVEVSDAEAGLDKPMVSVTVSGTGVALHLQMGSAVSDGLKMFAVNGLTERVVAP